MAVKNAVDFTPHLGWYRSSIIASSIGVAVGVAAWVLQAPVVGGIFGLWMARRAWTKYQDGVRRQRGLEVEAQHIEHLRSACAARGWTVTTDVWIDGVGNIDAVVAADFVHFIIEIKSYGGLKELANESIVRCNRLQTSAAKEVKQVHDQAFGLAGLYSIPRNLVTKILWCPGAKFDSVRETREGVTLANGPVKGSGSKLIEYIAQVSESKIQAFMEAAQTPTEPGKLVPRVRNEHTTALETLRTRVVA